MTFFFGFFFVVVFFLEIIIFSLCSSALVIDIKENI